MSMTRVCRRRRRLWIVGCGLQVAGGRHLAGGHWPVDSPGQCVGETGRDGGSIGGLIAGGGCPRLLVAAYGLIKAHEPVDARTVKVKRRAQECRLAWSGARNA